MSVFGVWELKIGHWNLRDDAKPARLAGIHVDN